MSSIASLYLLFADTGDDTDGSASQRVGHRGAQNLESGGSLAPAHPDYETVVALRHGDAAAFEQLFKSYYLPLRRFAAMVMTSAGEEGDIVEDVFAWLWDSRARLDVRGSLASYLYGAVRHRALNLLRNQRKQFDLQSRFAQELASAAGENGDNADSDNAGDLLQRVREVIAKLPERRRLVLTLRWESGLGNAEIAAVLGIAPQSVANLVQRALADVRSALPDEFQ